MGHSQFYSSAKRKENILTLCAVTIDVVTIRNIIFRFVPSNEKLNLNFKKCQLLQCRTHRYNKIVELFPCLGKPSVWNQFYGDEQIKVKSFPKMTAIDQLIRTRNCNTEW